jgi:ABC-2 type transport system ATP-binding protein
MIRLESVTREFEGGKGVHAVSLELCPGVHGLLGPNGAGKTTLLRLIMQLLVPDSGTIYVNGQDIWSDGIAPGYRRSIGFLPTDDWFFPFLSGKENLEFISKMKTGNPRAYEALGEAIEDFGVREFWDRPFGAYSTGMRRRVQIVGALVGDPRILILDEPNDGLDILANVELKRLVRREAAKGKAILISSHVLEFLDGLVDALTVLHEGRVAFDERPFSGDVTEAFLSAIGYRERGY